MAKQTRYVEIIMRSGKLKADGITPDPSAEYQEDKTIQRFVDSTECIIATQVIFPKVNAAAAEGLVELGQMKIDAGG